MRQPDWQSDKRWSDAYLPHIKRILGEHLIGEPPREEDEQRNTDLMVLRMDAVRIACRVRRSQYLDRYGDGFTIRASRPGGTKTEITKIIEGWGDYFLYGFASKSDDTLARWTLADLRVFRLWFSRELVRRRGETPGRPKSNHDRSSDFLAFTWAELPTEFVVATSHPVRCAA